MRKGIAVSLFFLLIFSITGCYSVFSGGTGGLLVDAESASSPKAGIANADVYAYTSEGDRNKDFNKWTEGTVFSPAVDYYGHTTTGNDGHFTLSKLVWKAGRTDFGKDADYTRIYLLFYHENYGLTKGSTVIISDSTTDTVYAELVPVRKTTILNISLTDVKNDSPASVPVYVKVTVPQVTDAQPSAAPKKYEATITGNGSISISYPRWKNAADKASGIENEPAVTIEYVHSADEITWKGCWNGDSENNDYAFRSDSSGVTTITKTVKNPAFSVSLYGKSTKLAVPGVQGQYSNAGTEADDGIIITMKGKDTSGTYSIDLGEATTRAEAVGTSGTQKHGVFTNLGSGFTWEDDAYTGKYATLDVQILAAGTEKKQMTLRSDKTSAYDVQL